MRFLAAITLLASVLFSFTAVAADQSIIVLDASGSMWGQIGGKAKIDIARETLGSVLKSVPSDSAIGLMVYGHRDKGSCSDIELAIPPATGTADNIRSFVKGITPKGKTPLSEAVKEAAEALKYTEEKATVILVTDGLETCEADPCALASALEKSGVDFTVHVVGFGLTKEEGKQVACLADNTGGKYFQASDAKQLTDALKKTVVEKPQPAPAPKPAPASPPPAPKVAMNVQPDAVLAEGGASLGENNDIQWKFFLLDANDNPAEDPVETAYKAHFSTHLDPGKYLGVATLHGVIVRNVPFEVKDNDVAKPFVNFDAAQVTLVPRRAKGAEPDSNAVLELKFGDYEVTEYGQKVTYISAGDAAIKATIGPASVEETLTVKAGEILTHEIIIGSGIVTAKAVYADGGPDVDSREIFFEIVPPKKNIDGSRKTVAYNYGNDAKLDAPTGDYLLVATLGKAVGETAFTLSAGQAKNVTVNINGGVIAITATGADRIEVVSAKKDIQGNRKEITATYGPEWQDTVPPGDYIARATFTGDTAPKEKPVTVKAGERSEVSLD
ncbi:VWA domain-containing protein [Rhizobium sp. XQZ8]|uniref:vWA domain-containing protein n=1 Tax=Rhizobium populisoli TaxID=2859785 RepID=UPI001CA4C22E|nr:VWA domain-containing protein [Rhizobium populisoli]MBW6421041.1 VWA domain-containing protein [Rhizobium populisoli]